MVTEDRNPARPEPDGTQPELLISSVLHLMSHYTANSHEPSACDKLAPVIERHLKMLADLPSLAPVLRETCRQLSEQWAAVVKRAMPQPERPRLFARLISSARLRHP